MFFELKGLKNLIMVKVLPLFWINPIHTCLIRGSSELGERRFLKNPSHLMVMKFDTNKRNKMVAKIFL